MSAQPAIRHPENIVVVLVRPQHPGNIGAACRAMKNMGLHRLRLVSPPLLSSEGPAAWMATGARDVLEQAEVFVSLAEALADITTVVGTTARERHGHYTVTGPRALGEYLIPRSAHNPVAILFGQEDHGLDNDAISRCELLVRIPTTEFSSLNLSQAVLLVAYELMMAGGSREAEVPRALSSLEERERMTDAILSLAARVEFLKGRSDEHLRAFFRGVTGRLAMDSQEVGAVLGLIRKVRWHLAHPGHAPEGTE